MPRPVAHLAGVHERQHVDVTEDSCMQGKWETCSIPLEKAHDSSSHSTEDAVGT